MADFGSTLLEIALGTSGGFLAALVSFRTRLALSDRKKMELESRLSAMERRQLIQLQLLADIARKLHLTNRFTDTIVRMLAEDDANGGERRGAARDDLGSSIDE